MGQQGRSAGTPLTPEDPSAIGPYELISRLGSGGMGTVYLAKAADGVQVALKAIRRDYTTDPVYRARFHEEVSNARKVASFCTARVLDHGEHDGVLYLVTEYIEGVSLENHLIEHGPLTPSVLHSAAVGVAAALTAIHAVGLVHRDLKPANVMLTLGGPRVIDFGLARSSHVSTRHTNAGMVMGTPGWIAPEQVFEGRTSPAGDVFAWGSLIAYAGLGGHPFGEGDAYVMAARARTAPPDLRGLPAPLDRLVAAAIHPDPARRPAAKQLLLELVGAADEPAAQLAATRHLTSSWNPSEFPPLAEFPNNPQVRQAPPGWTPPPQAHQPSAHQPQSHQPSSHQPSSHQPQAHQQTGMGPLPGRGPAPHPPAQAPPPPPPRQSPRQAPPHQASPRQASPPPGPASQVPPSLQTGQVPLSAHQTGQVPLSAHQTGQAPLPRGPVAFPVKRKRSVFSGCVTAVVVAIVLLVLLLAVLVWALRSPDAVGADSPVQDGKLKFAVTGTKCPKPAKGAKQRTCQVSLKVNNVGQEARVLYPGQQKLLDGDDALHGGTKLLDKAGAEVTPVRIGPGQSFSGALLFELPKEAQPAGLELHDSGLSTGVRVRLD
ncbi:protein kinase [Nonomuraea sp. NPDC052129]|uniref:protein kinase domain-containing protein n=1 Tax=Nonomuraea sp. NPDC052129 TaxID=3154651 RepID=UPI0034254DF9